LSRPGAGQRLAATRRRVFDRLTRRAGRGAFAALVGLLAVSLLTVTLTGCSLGFDPSGTYTGAVTPANLSLLAMADITLAGSNAWAFSISYGGSDYTGSCVSRSTDALTCTFTVPVGTDTLDGSFTGPLWTGTFTTPTTTGRFSLARVT